MQTKTTTGKIIVVFILILTAVSFSWLCLLSPIYRNAAAYAEQPSAIQVSNSRSPSVTFCDGHVRRVDDVRSEEMEIYDHQSMKPVKTVPASDYISISRDDYINLLFDGNPAALEAGEYYIYFYNSEKKVIWDEFDYIDGKTGERNRISAQNLKELNGFQFSDISSAAYIRIALANGYNCQLMIWDGEPVGYPVTALATVFDREGNKIRLPDDASISIQIPETARYLIAKPGYTFIGMVLSNNNASMQVNYSDLRFPGQVVDLRNLNLVGCAKNVRVRKDIAYASLDMPNGDLSKYIISVDERDYQPAAFNLAADSDVMERINACMDFVWEAKAPVGDFKAGITYHGIPYRNSWTTANFVGWHVSKQTFMNAANDPESIFYKNESKTRPGPYYSLVCSSFGSLVCGMKNPNLVFGLEHDPNNTVTTVSYPVVGTLMTQGGGHCYIPISAVVDSAGETVLTVAEQIGPLTAIRNIYPGTSNSWQGIGTTSSYATNYTNSIICQQMEEVPYNITEYVIKNGSARPFRGDQSVYTSDMDVVVNIKEPNATRLYYQEFDVECRNGLIKSARTCGDPKYIAITPGTVSVNLRSATDNNSYTGVELKNGGIYGVWASEGVKQNTAPSNVEFFEWYDLSKETVSFDIVDGKIISNEKFWYARANISINDDGTQGKQEGGCTIPYTDHLNESGSYGILNSEKAIAAFFRKGQLGAYVTSKEYLSPKDTDS